MRERRGWALAATGVMAVALAAGVRAPAAAWPGVGGYAAYCDSCNAPVANTWGVEWVNGRLWTLAQDGTLTRLSGSCTPDAIVSVQGFRGFATGLGWDSRRGAFLVVDALLDSIEVVDTRGVVLRTFATPGTGAVGAAYDPLRDAYWMTDFETRELYAIDAATGATVARFALENNRRVAGAAYDARHDAIVYHQRIAAAAGYIVSCATGAVLDSFPMPFTGINGWQDNALAADGTLWVDNFENDAVYCFDVAYTPVRRTTWGALKQRYR